METLKTCEDQSTQTTECSDTEEKNLKEEIKNLWKNFLLETSLHGCSSIPKSQYHWLRRLLWLLFLAASASFLIMNVVDFYVSLNKHPFKTKTGLERVKSLPLPAISICSDMLKRSMVNNSNTLNEYLIANAKFVQAFGEFTVKASFNEIKQLDYLPYEEVGIKKEDLILKAIINGRDANVTSEFHSITTPLFGQCLTYNKVGEDGEGGNITLSYGQNLHMILNISQEAYFPAVYGGMMLMFHDPKDLPTPSSVFISAVPGFITNIYLKATELKFLPKPYKSFGEEYCVESAESSSRTMKWHREYTWYGCVEECIITNVVNLCNCTTKDRRIPESVSDRICSFEELYGCFDPYLLKGFLSVLSQSDTMCDCPQPCETIQYDVRTSVMTFPSKPVADFLIKNGAASSYQDLRWLSKVTCTGETGISGKNDLYKPFQSWKGDSDSEILERTIFPNHCRVGFSCAWDNYASVDISFEQMVLHHEEHVPEMNAGDIFGKLGGQMGLFLGASILTLLELAETMLITFILLGKAFLGFCTGRRRAATK